MPPFHFIVIAIISAILLSYGLPVDEARTAYATRAVSRYDILKQDAPETLVSPVRDDFMSEDCYNRAVVLFAEYGDWATQGNYSEMELCD
jgi:hypothetical protein